MRSLNRFVNTKGGGVASKKGKIIIPHWRGRLTNKKENQLRYLSHVIYREGVQSNFVVHRLVAEAFIPNPENKPQVNHIDGNRENNTVQNLEWCTNRENRDHAIKNHLTIPMGEKHHNAKLTWKQIEEIRQKYIPRVYSQRKLASEYGVDQATIWAVLQKQTWVTPEY